jgi:phi LC3 family holin
MKGWIKMKINWKIRLRNKAFLAALAALTIAFVYQLLAALDIVPRISQDSITEVIGMVLNLLGLLGVLVDPTTAGVSDSERALTYGTENDVRAIEGDGGGTGE